MPEPIDTITLLAREAGCSDEAIRKWFERGRVAHTARFRILERARSHAIELPLEAFDDFQRPRLRRRRAA
jgi:hypothetical protein